MKSLDNFTVERLEKWIAAGDTAKDHHDDVRVAGECLAALARIALAAKRAEPDYYIVKLKFNDGWGDETVLDTYETKLDASKSKDDHSGEIVPVYTTPQLNSPEIPEDWIKFQEQKPIANQYISFVSRHGEYASGLVGEDEWVEMHDGTSFALDEIYIWLLLPPLPAAPEKENG